MNKYTVILAFILTMFCYQSNAQILLNQTSALTRYRFTKTYVALKGINDKDSTAEQYRKQFQDNWKFTPEIVFIEPFKIYPENSDPNGLYIFFKSERAEVGGTDGQPSQIDLKNKPYYSLVFMCYPSSKTIIGTIDGQKEIARLLLSIDRGQRKIFTLKVDRSPEGHEIRYDGESIFLNWKLGYVKNYLQNLSSLFLSPPASIPFYLNQNQAYMDKGALKNIQNDTLYFSDRVNIEKYPYKKVVLTEEELNNKILNSEEPFYYVNVVSYSFEHITVFEAKTGKIIYYVNGIPNKWNQVNKLVKDINRKEPFIKAGKSY